MIIKQVPFQQPDRKGWTPGGNIVLEDLVMNSNEGVGFHLLVHHHASCEVASKAWVMMRKMFPVTFVVVDICMGGPLTTSSRRQMAEATMSKSDTMMAVGCFAASSDSL